ncbi:hypothetical protein KSP39_PZI003782 [Platanthera zijinensis]|uniref:Uncharacterized protein n=1 Tax=Platanthera zijinensis TaxID=2320716 RepID=A0AAP0BU30_9ASPA
MPKTAVSILFLIKSLGVKDSPLKEEVVVIGKEQGIALLEASLQSDNALTDSFLNPSMKKEAAAQS